MKEKQKYLKLKLNLTYLSYADACNEFIKSIDTPAPNMQSKSDFPPLPTSIGRQSKPDPSLPIPRLALTAVYHSSRMGQLLLSKWTSPVYCLAIQ